MVTGSNGMLGKEIVKTLLKRTSSRIHGVDIKENVDPIPGLIEHVIDLTDISLLNDAISIIKPDIIIHTAAIVNLKSCEDDFGLARRLHVDVSRVLAKTNANIIYISTDSIFNGSKGYYNEVDIPDPLNNYAKTKYLGELAIQANSQNYIIIRTNIFGFNLPLKSSLAEWGLKSLANSEIIHGYTDVIFNPLYTKHLAIGIWQLIELNFIGIINIAGTTPISKYEFLRYLAKFAGYDNNLIRRSISKEINGAAPRPLKTVLNTAKASNLILLPSTQSGIEQLAIDYKKVNHE